MENTTPEISSVIHEHKSNSKSIKRSRERGIHIHKEIFSEAGDDVKDLIKKHLSDTVAIHKAFWKKLKKVVKNK